MGFFIFLFLFFIFKSSTDFVVISRYNQKEKDKGSAEHGGVPQLIRTSHISAGFVQNTCRVMDSLCIRSPRRSLAVLAPQKIFHRMNLCGVTQLQNGL